jgi:hypothetical protein
LVGDELNAAKPNILAISQQHSGVLDFIALSPSYASHDPKIPKTGALPLYPTLAFSGKRARGFPRNNGANAPVSE